MAASGGEIYHNSAEQNHTPVAGNQGFIHSMDMLIMENILYIILYTSNFSSFYFRCVNYDLSVAYAHTFDRVDQFNIRLHALVGNKRLIIYELLVFILVVHIRNHIEVLVQHFILAVPV